MTATEFAATGSVDDLTPTLRVEHLEVTHRVRGNDRRALRDVSFEIGRRESYGLVGESGSGKSTVALALAAEPSLLILDEPTTALDATVEAEVLDLVAGLREGFATSVLFISHNLAVIAKMCDRVGVLYAGELLEEGPAQQVFDEPRHPYTVGLLRCIPRRGQRKDHGRLDTIPGFLPAPGAVPTGCI